jgi:hypothetical protein
MKMKQRSVPFLLLVLTLAASSGRAQKIEYGTQDINLKRIGSLSTNKHLELWTEAVKEVNGKIVPMVNPANTGEEGAHWLIAITTGNKLWKGDELQTAVSTQLLARIPLISKQTFNEWSATLLESAGEKEFPHLNKLIFLLLLRPDRLYDGRNFKTDEFGNMISRLRSITPKDASKWADATRVYTIEAAVSLIEEDSLFSNNVLQREAFQSKLDDIQNTKKNK